MTKNVLLKDVKLDTTTSFFANGDIKVYACPWNEGFEPLTPEKKVSYRGRITVMEDGNAEVKLTIHQVWDIRRREQPAVDAFFLTLKEDNTCNR